MHSCSHHSADCVVAAAVVGVTATSPGLNIGPVVDIALDIVLAWELVVVGDRGVVWVAGAAAAAA